MKKKNMLIIICLFLIIGSYFAFKVFCLYYYDINTITTENYKEFIDSFKFTNTLTINNNTLNDNEYLQFENIKIRNDFNNFKKLEQTDYTNDFERYVLYDNDEQVKAAFYIGVTDQYVYHLKNDRTLFGTGDKRVSNASLSKFLEENNINDDLELFEFLQNNKNVENNIFTSVKEMKDKFTIQFMVSIMLPSITNMTLINGDYNGFIFNMKSPVKEVSILKNEKRYIFTFFKTDYFTDNYITELLNTVVID